MERGMKNDKGESRKVETIWISIWFWFLLKMKYMLVLSYEFVYFY